MLWRAAVALGALASCVILVGACQRTEIRRTEERSTTTTIQRVSSVIGANVQIERGTAVAKVEDLVINDDGCIDFVVVRYEEHFVPIPWSLATVEFDQRIVTVDITRERFAQAPSFAGDRWVELRSDQFTEKVRSFFGDGKRGGSNLKRAQPEGRRPADQNPERPKEPAKDKQRPDKEPTKDKQRPDKEPTKDKQRPDKEPSKDKSPQTQPERP